MINLYYSNFTQLYHDLQLYYKISNHKNKTFDIDFCGMVNASILKFDFGTIVKIEIKQLKNLKCQPRFWTITTNMAYYLVTYYLFFIFCFLLCPNQKDFSDNYNYTRFLIGNIF